MCKFNDRDVSAALIIRRCAVGPGPRLIELCHLTNRPAMPNPGQPGQDWVIIPDKPLLRKGQRQFQRVTLAQRGSVPSYRVLPVLSRRIRLCSAAKLGQSIEQPKTEALERDDSGQPSSAQPSPDSPREEPGNQRQPPFFARLLGSIGNNNHKPPNWVTSVVAAFTDANGRPDLRMLRLVVISLAFLLVASVREVIASRTRITTREVAYSDFYTLLDSGRVRAARLESGVGRMYFDMQPLTTPAPAAAAQAATTPVPALTASDLAVASAALKSSSAHSTLSPAAAAAAASGTRGSAATAVAPGAALAPDSAEAVESSPAAAGAAAPVTAAAAPAAHQAAPMRFQKQYVVKLAERSDSLLVAKILAMGVEYSVLKQTFLSALATTLTTTLAVWIPLLPLLFLFRRIMEDRSSSRKKKSDGRAQPVLTTFADVAGVESAKVELMEVVSVMKKVKTSYATLNVKMPSGVLLCGPPGTGKTLLAKAVAGEAGVPFISVGASEFVEMFVGRGAARIRELFAEARKSAPCVVFIDELDAVGARRGMGYNDERDQTLNQLLTELDGFEGRSGVLFLAATNRADILDPALLRPGRINRKVVVPLPDEAGRREILGVHLRNTPMLNKEAKAEACSRLARVTSGFSGAELANVVNEAALLSARKDSTIVTISELIEGVQRTKFGVNGRSGTGSGQGFQKWLLDLAAGPDSRKRVKTSTA
ncbi:hypothetical protein QJQ45_012046 [Haematococcus lacustris]|nr:hypothetical protein QJQ45_012046 [Haematococcus lacustris]